MREWRGCATNNKLPKQIASHVTTCVGFQAPTCTVYTLRPCPCTPAPQDAVLAASGWVPAVGQTVFVPKLGKRFKVASVNAATGQLQLQAGKLKLKATVEEVRAE